MRREAATKAREVARVPGGPATRPAGGEVLPKEIEEAAMIEVADPPDRPLRQPWGMTLPARGHPRLAGMVDRTARVAAPAALALLVVAGCFFGRQPLVVAVAAGLGAVAVAAVIAARGTTGRALMGGLALAGTAATVIS